MPHKKKNKLSKEAQKWISHKIELLINEGRERSQAVAMAHDMARRRGFKVPKKKGRKKT